MFRKLIVLIIGGALLLIGIKLSGQLLAGLFGNLVKGHDFSEWSWQYDELGKVAAGIVSAIAGLLILLVGLLRKRSVLWLFVSVFFILLITASGIISYRLVIDNLSNQGKEVSINIEPGKEIMVEIPYNSNTTSIAGILKGKGLIKSAFIYKVLSKMNGYDGMYQSGAHKLSMGLKYEEIMRILANKPESVKVTFPEGYTYKQIADELFKKKLIDKEKFDTAANSEKFDFKFLNNLPPREHRLEGYLFPDTYEFDVKAGEKEIIRRILYNFDVKFKPEYYNKAKELKMTVDQIITLASIIEREAQQPGERRTIAGVFYKRLNSKDKTLRRLQSCATIQFIIFNKEGNYKKVLTENDTKIQDPYNTYESEGLPPGPICSPGKDSIEAALNPENTDYLYFVAKGDGYHQFSRTYKEHQDAIKKYGLK